MLDLCDLEEKIREIKEQNNLLVLWRVLQPGLLEFNAHAYAYDIEQCS